MAVHEQDKPTDEEIEEAEFIAAFYGTDTSARRVAGVKFDIEQWARHPNVAPSEAARILFGREPFGALSSDEADAKSLESHFRGVESIDKKPRTLVNWVEVVQEQALDHDQDIAKAIQTFSALAVMAASQQSQGVHSIPEAVPSTSVAGASSTTPSILDDVIPLVPVQRSAAQNAAIVTALRERGYDPKALPVVAPGRKGAKAEIKKILLGSALWRIQT